MFFASPVSTGFRRPHSPVGQSLERFLDEARLASRQVPCTVEQDEKSFTLRFDVPGIGKDQLTIGVEGSIVRIESKEAALRQYRCAYELPQEIDASSSEAKLENGVLTVKLGKLLPVSRITQLTIN